jgi:hypothetical protein
VRAGQFQFTAALAGFLALAAAMDVSAIAMPLDLGFGQVGHDVVFVLAGGLELEAAAMGALGGMNVVFDEDGIGRWLGPKEARVLTVLGAAAVGSGGAGFLARVAGAFTALVDLVELAFQLRQAAPEFSVLRLQLRDPIQKLLPIIHSGRIVVQDDEVARGTA